VQILMTMCIGISWHSQLLLKFRQLRKVLLQDRADLKHRDGSGNTQGEGSSFAPGTPTG
jgi:hypothetical protein